MTWLRFCPYLVAAHVTSVVFLVGGLLALDRIVAVVARQPLEQRTAALSALLKFERQVATPALLLVWISGLALAISAGWFGARWLMLKLVFVVALSALHGMQSGRLRRAVREGTAVRDVPCAGIGIVAGMLVIAILAFGKPM